MTSSLFEQATHQSTSKDLSKVFSGAAGDAVQSNQLSSAVRVLAQGDEMESPDDLITALGIKTVRVK